MIVSSVINGFCKNLITDLTFIQQFQEAKSPQLPYSAWRIISVTSPIRHRKEYGVESDALVESIDATKILKLELQFFSQTEEQAINKNEVFKGANEYSSDFLNMLYSDTSKAYQIENNFSVINWNDLSIFVGFLGDIHELKSIIELDILYTDNVTVSSNSVDTDEINTTINIEDI